MIHFSFHKKVKSLQICDWHLQHPSSLTFSILPLSARQMPKRASVFGWRSTAVRGRGRGRGLVWWGGWRRTESVSQRFCGRQYTILSGPEWYNTFFFSFFLTEFSPSELLSVIGGWASHAVIFTLWLSVCSPLCQTQRCMECTWSQWEALQSRANSKFPTEDITTWTSFPRYTNK